MSEDDILEVLSGAWDEDSKINLMHYCDLAGQEIRRYREMFSSIAAYTGELTAAAKHDLQSADPADVGMNGVSIVEWCKAYLEGCRDMANGVYTRVDEKMKAGFEKAARAAFDATLAEEKRLSETADEQYKG